MLGKFVQRVSDYSRRRSLAALPGDALLRAYRGLFCNWHYVFECDRPAAPAAPPPGVDVLHVAGAADLSPALRRQIVDGLGPRMDATTEALFAAGAELHLATRGERVIALLWTRYGRDVVHWFIPLRASDVVLYAAATLPAHRGLGVMSWLIAELTRGRIVADAKAYADAKIWNRPAIRAIEKAGYRRVARMRPLQEER
jgi:GNAT superfamily N-acetyltransferase